MELFRQELNAFIEGGTIRRIVEKHTKVQRDESLLCSSQKAQQVPLGMNNLYFPFLLLAGGVALCALALALEKASCGRSPRQPEESPEVRQALLQIRSILDSGMAPNDQLVLVKMLLQSANNRLWN